MSHSFRHEEHAERSMLEKINKDTFQELDIFVLVSSGGVGKGCQLKIESNEKSS